jgi:hypothetical protein
MLGHASAAMTPDVYAASSTTSWRSDDAEPDADSVRTEEPDDGQQDGPGQDDQGRDLQ